MRSLSSARAASSRAATKTSAPSRASASAQARPSPRLAAVTSALRPWSPRSISARKVPVGHVLETVDGVDDGVEVRAADPPVDRVLVVGLVEEQGRRRAGEQGLK